MNLVFTAAVELQTFCQRQGWRFCLIGGVALQRWGEPRQTVDVDITLLTGFGGEENFIRPLLERFRPRRPDAAGFALRNRVLLVENAEGVGLDIALGGLPFEARTIERASPYDIGGGHKLITCSAFTIVRANSLRHSSETNANELHPIANSTLGIASCFMETNQFWQE